MVLSFFDKERTKINCSFYRRLQEAEDQNRELLTTVARREEALHQNNVSFSSFHTVNLFLDTLMNILQCIDKSRL